MEHNQDLVTDITQYEQGTLILDKTANQIKNTHDIKIPSELLVTIAKTIQLQPNIKDKVKNTEEIGKTLWEVVIRPDLQDGIDTGELLWNGCAVEIKNAKTGKIAGKVQLQKTELPESRIVDKAPVSPLSSITRNICSISGQLQMAEMSKKIDTIIEKLDLLREEFWREKISRLKATTELIEEAIGLLPDERALDRINKCIEELHVLSKFFESSIDNVLGNKISFSLWQSFLEGLKFWEFGKNDRPEYNNEFFNKVKEFLGEYNILIELYSQTMGLLGSCYQTLHGYQQGQKYYNKMHDQINCFSSEMVNKLIYVLDIRDVSIEENPTIEDINKGIIHRHIPLLKEIQETSEKIDKAHNMYENLISQLDNSQISLTVDTYLLLGGKNND